MTQSSPQARADVTDQIRDPAKKKHIRTKPTGKLKKKGEMRLGEKPQKPRDASRRPYNGSKQNDGLKPNNPP